MKPLCIYHGNCADGVGAAWVVRKALNGDVDFHAATYGDAPPDVTGRAVIMVDFSYKRPMLEQMRDTALSVTILDHHKTAEADLKDLAYVTQVFDMNRSGAGITWDYFFPDQPRPPLINTIEDRDLWRFALPNTREIQANVFSHPYDFAVWDLLMNVHPNILIDEGTGIERKHHKDIDELLGVVTREMKISGYHVPVANLPYTLTSDAGNKLALKAPFAACYWDTPKGRVFSLRSVPGGVDVSVIAATYGGGGHKHAAGFTVPYGHPLTLSQDL